AKLVVGSPPVRIPGEPTTNDPNNPGTLAFSVPIGDLASFDIGVNNGAGYKFLKILSSVSFRLDSVGLIPGHGGPENSAPATSTLPSTAFPTAVIGGNIGSAAEAAAVGTPGDNLAAQMVNGSFITIGSSGLDLPSVIAVDRVQPVPFT